MSALLALALLAGSAAADALPRPLSDPTRPPSMSPETGEAQPQETRLQSILISPGRKLAVIDGKTVPLGGRVGDATLVAIGVAEVTLRRGQQLETLHLFPALKDRASSRPPTEGEKK